MKPKNRIVQQFIKAFEVAKKRNWYRIYIGIDIHETMLKPTWSKDLSSEYYPCAKETLQLMSQNKMISMILWSCSLPEFNKKYQETFQKDEIEFNYINENPECASTDYADFESKLYFSVGLDDKFGFIPDEDWEALYHYFKTINPIIEIKRADAISMLDREYTSDEKSFLDYTYSRIPKLKSGDYWTKTWKHGWDVMRCYPCDGVPHFNHHETGTWDPDQIEIIGNMIQEHIPEHLKNYD